MLFQEWFSAPLSGFRKTSHRSWNASRYESIFGDTLMGLAGLRVHVSINVLTVAVTTYSQSNTSASWSGSYVRKPSI
jgi:hypothetical protein